MNDEALGNELAARFYLEWDKSLIAQNYMINAYYGHVRWGAKTKVVSLESHYPQLLAPVLQPTCPILSVSETLFALESVASTSSFGTSISNFLDLAVILKASQTLSGEIALEKLLSSLFSIMLENARADRYILMLLQDEKLLIQGSITVGTEPDVLQRLLIEESKDIPHKLIYKLKHNRQIAVIVDASADLTLENDPYIMRQQPKSILCSPILYQGQLKGILYLENNLMVGAFTSDRVELRNLLCTQAAISLKNAQLYAKKQEKLKNLAQALTNLQNAQLQSVQSEKMSALGNLVAGMDHEINNPAGFLTGNITDDSIHDLFGLLDPAQQKYLQLHPEIQEGIETIEFDYIRQDLPQLVKSMQEGIKRIQDISVSLKNFSRGDSDRPVACNIHDGIDSTITILKHRLNTNESRPEIKVTKNYSELLKIKCYARKINQVFMNILANAINTLDESDVGRSFAEIQANSNRIIFFADNFDGNRHF